MAVLMNPDGSPISLFFQQIWCEIDLISGDYLNAELSQGILTVKEAEQLVQSIWFCKFQFGIVNSAKIMIS